MEEWDRISLHRRLMKYQLVLQWSTSARMDYDALIEIEDELVTRLNPRNDVDDTIGEPSS